MKNRGISVYNDSLDNTRFFRPPIEFNFSFFYTPKIDAVGLSSDSDYIIKFKDKYSGISHYIGNINSGLFTSLFRRWFTPWIVEIFDGNNKIYDFDFEKSLMNGRVGISIDSSSLGDTLAWVPVVELFRIKYNCKVDISTYWNEFLKPFYQNLSFYEPGKIDNSYDAVFGLGWYDEVNNDMHKRDPRTISLQEVAGDILGISLDADVKPIEIPSILKDSLRPIDKKYVCISMNSTADAKHWHYPGGWQNIVDYLKNAGYEVVVIQKQEHRLEGVIDESGDMDIMNRAWYLFHADFSIGIGSGLPWLAWFLDKPVVMISGFSLPRCEFKSRNYRVINTDVCHGCFSNIKYKFDRGNWFWCPVLGNSENRFECSKSISPDMVKDAIADLVLKEGLELPYKPVQNNNL